MKRFLTFLKTELKLSLREMNMPIFAVIMPLITVPNSFLLISTAVFSTSLAGTTKIALNALSFMRL